MTAPRWQKVLSDLWSNRARTALVIASIAVGLFAIGIIATLYLVIAEDMRVSYTAVNAASIAIQTEPFDQDMLDHLRKLDGVRQVAATRAFDLRIRDAKGDWQGLHLQTVTRPEDIPGGPINRVALKQGAWPPGEGEIVVDQYKLPELGAKLGDKLTIQLADGTTYQMKLVGVVQDLTIGAFSGGGGFFDAPAQGYIVKDSLEALGQPQPELFNMLFATNDGGGDNKAAMDAVSMRLSNALEDNGVDVINSRTNSAYEHPIAYLVNAIVGVLLVLGLLVVFLSGFLITSTLQSLLGQQVQQIGIMKSVGARWLQVAGIYMILILIFGLIALAVASPLAMQVSFGLLGFLAGKMNFIAQGQRVVWPVVVIEAALALIMPQVAAWLPIWKGTRISVQEALSGIQPGERKKHTARTSAEIDAKAGAGAAITPTPKRGPDSNRGRKKLFSRPMLISMRNTFRRKGRLALTLLTLTLGGAVFIGTFNVQVSMNNYIEQISHYFLSDVSVSFDRPYRTSRIEEILRSLPGVSHVEGWSTARSELLLPDGTAGESVSVLAPPPGSTLIEPQLIAGRWIEAGDTDAIVLGELFQDRYPGLKVGDRFELQVNSKKTEWTVVGFFRFAGKNGGYAAYTSFDYLSAMTGQANRAVTYQVVGSHAKMTVEEQDAMARMIEARMKEEGIQVADITTGSELTGIAGSGFNILITFLLILAGLTALVGSIGLAGTMSMNVLERTREIGVMRAIGASNRILMKMVLVEGMIIGAISYVLGALLAFPISKLMADGISRAIFDAPSTFGATWVGFAIWLGLVVALSLVASIIPARNASRLTIREVLSYE